MMHILTNIKRKRLFDLIRQTKGDIHPQLLFYAINADFVLGAMYLRYIKRLRCEGLEARSRLMAFVLRIPYRGPKPLYDFQKGIKKWGRD